MENSFLSIIIITYESVLLLDSVSDILLLKDVEWCWMAFKHFSKHFENAKCGLEQAGASEHGKQSKLTLSSNSPAEETL